MGEKRPFDVLNQALNNSVLVRLKGSVELRGTFVAYDVHMNVVLEDAEELDQGNAKRKLGTLFLRGDSVVFISPSV